MQFKLWLTSRNLIFAFATIMHMTWGFSLLLSSESLQTTGVALMIKLCNCQGGAGVAFIFASVLAMFSIANYPDRPITNMLLMMPQQVFLVIAALSAIFCIIDGRFADGTLRSPVFLLIDQFWLVLICLLHSVALFFRFGNHRKIILEVHQLAIV